MSHEQAQANPEIVFDRMNAMRYRDIDTIGRLFDPAVVWVDVAGGVAVMDAITRSRGCAPHPPS